MQERRRPGLLRLLLQRKRRRKSPRGVSSLSPSASRFPPSPHSPPFPPALPPGPGSILTSSLEERKRPGLLHLLSRGKGGGEARGALLLCLVLVAAPPVPLVPDPPFSPTPPATPTHPLRPVTGRGKIYFYLLQTRIFVQYLLQYF